ncbi:syntaxin, partial [Thalassiosira pseudonana CCMP1335]
LAELRSFRTAAATISHDVSTTSALLAELTRLVKTGAGGTRMFADESANERADALVLRIKSNIEGLHSRLEEASLVLERSKRRLGKNSQAGMEASNLVGQLKEDFVKTTSGFKEVLEKRSDGMKDAKDRKRRERVDLLTLMNKPTVYGGGNDQRASSFGDGGLPAGESSSQLPRPHGISGSGYDNNGLRLQSGAQRQYQLIPDQDYLRQRADAMTQVESNIVELGTIFNKLAVMVNEHREMVQRVEDNVEDTNANVNLSLATLTDTLRDLQTNRALGMKVLGILVLFIIMFIIFFA